MPAAAGATGPVPYRCRGQHSTSEEGLELTAEVLRAGRDPRSAMQGLKHKSVAGSSQIQSHSNTKCLSPANCVVTEKSGRLKSSRHLS